ncbi:MAG: dipeptide/oligopeptide/nickel ABC transporter ATP-binding protein [Chloroflexi bacterium]|nr:MAG: dipeptide/oligopeptide/nickel ABC transporter ATP-binding protein [Chloroflexota bacterium]
MSEPVLSVRDLKVHYHTPAGRVRAVDGVSFDLRRGENLGLVGESGSGKSTTVLALLGLVMNPGRIEGGQALLGGVDLLKLSEAEMRRMSGAEISLIPQGAMNSLNPVMRVKTQMMDTIRAHDRTQTQDAMMAHIVELLQLVGLDPSVADMYPHELSGGMKQRVCIAMAITLQPQVIIADEPTSALDVVVQRQVMETLSQIQETINASVILVGHDMGLMAQFVDRVGIMYAGRLVELGPVDDIFERPLHPYTRLLIGTLPSLDVKGVFKGIPGLTPSLLAPPSGCVFHPRCPNRTAACLQWTYDFREIRPGHWVACNAVDENLVQLSRVTWARRNDSEPVSSGDLS